MTSTGTGADTNGGWQPGADLRMDRPTAARMYDYYLGGKDNFAVDREAADRVVELLGERAARQGPLENRAFLRRAVRFLAEQGVDQFIDLGAGLPTQGNVHEVVQQVNPDARVIYVDNDPIVLAHGRALLADSRTVDVITADLRDPEAVLTNPATLRLIDLSRPVALLFFAVLQFVLDEEKPAEIVASYQSAVAPGSWMALSHVTMEGFPAEMIEEVTTIYQQSASPATTRSRAEIAALLGRMEPVDPGLVRAWEWRPEPTDEWRTDWFFGAVGQLRG
jgi:O-methyltransferase involved in polyketide biosynthesis